MDVVHIINRSQAMNVKIVNLLHLALIKQLLFELGNIYSYHMVFKNWILNPMFNKFT